MTLRWVLAAAHLLPLSFGLMAVWLRGQALRNAAEPSGLRRAFVYDNLWGAAAVIWLISGPIRAFGGLEKGTTYYLSSPAFWVKMGLLGLILLLEIWPMVTLIRWRIQLGRGTVVDTRPAGAIRAISMVQTALIVAMVLVATAMARGIGV